MLALTHVAFGCSLLGDVWTQALTLHVSEPKDAPAAVDVRKETATLRKFVDDPCPNNCNHQPPQPTPENCE